MIMASQEVQHGIQRISSDLAHLLLGDLGKCEGGGSLEVHIVGKREGGERSEGGTGEEVSGSAV